MDRNRKSYMTGFLMHWIRVSFLNLFVVAVLGFVLRYKIAYSLPFIDQKFLLHSHSHFAFSGWVTQCLMILLVHYLSIKEGEGLIRKYAKVLYANLAVSYVMLFSFLIQGYQAISITSSTLSILIFFWFAYMYWKDLNSLRINRISHKWFKASLVFGIVSSAGVFMLAWLMANKLADQNWYLSSVYFFLHFQYNGWFLFAGLGLLSDQLEQNSQNRKKLDRAFILFCSACVPAYLLSVLWLPFPGIIFIVLIASVLAQLYGWLIILNAVAAARTWLSFNFTRFGRIVLLFAALAFTIKLVLQTGSVHPALSQLSYGFRPIIIGYLHLVLLGVTSIFLIGYILSLKLIAFSRILKYGAAIFVSGVIINELFLLIQGVAALNYSAIPFINLMLLFAALVLLAGTLLMYLGCFNKVEQDADEINGTL